MWIDLFTRFGGILGVMMKKIQLVLVLFLCILGLSACGQQEYDEDKVFPVYYVSNSETKVEMHEHVMQASTTEGQLDEMLECLAAMPEKLAYKAPLSMGFQVISVELEDGKVLIDVDKA